MSRRARSGKVTTGATAPSRCGFADATELGPAAARSSARSSHRLVRMAGLLAVVACVAVTPSSANAARYTLVGWNNLGMHCMDGDYSLFSLLPPYNTVVAQLVEPSGGLVTDPAAAGIQVTYEAVADPDGSINTTSAGKTNFWDHVRDLFGVSLPVDSGLAGNAMPGAGNPARPMAFDQTRSWFIAEGIPIAPYDDAGRKNYYPMMRLRARSATGAVLATTDVVLPVSDEMDCRACHASGSGAAARPAAGWALDPNPQLDFRRNVLRVHDERQAGNPLFADALARAGYDPGGLEATADGGRAVLCAGCHLSEALPGSGIDGVPALTRALHGSHASAIDPISGLALDDSTNRAACYRCHPGSVTRCLRGVMGSAVAADGSLAMQCQSCHGSMSAVGSPDRTGWFDEPACQGCHTGTATNNGGQIRFTSVFDASGQPRAVVDRTFATNADTPAAGLSLYRFSSGHGDLQCATCHGSTHAEFPAAHRNDNLQSIALQGHVGVLAECTACHASSPQTVSGGPHGMHPVGQTWVSRHGDVVEHGGVAGCRNCHGADDRGTVLSRAQADRVLDAGELGVKQVWRGFQIGCYACHRGASSDDRNPNRAAVVVAASAATAAGVPVQIALSASDLDRNPLVLRVVSQPAHGTAGLSGSTATYTPEVGFVGADSFTFAAWDGSIDSNLATATIAVQSGAADLVVDWKKAPRLICRGNPAICRVRGRIAVRNAGTGAAGSSTVALYLSPTAELAPDATPLAEFPVRQLPPGRARGRVVHLPVAAAADAVDAYVVAVADFAGVIAEANEDNAFPAGPIDPVTVR